MQPIDAFDLDAAIIFADILPPLEGLGLKVGFEAGEGPIDLQPGPRRSRCPRLGLPRHRGGHLVHPRGHPACPAGVGGPWHSPHRLQRRALHPRLLRDRRRRQQGFRARQATDDGTPGPLAATDGQAHRSCGRLPSGPGRSGGSGSAALRHLGGSSQPADYAEFALPYNQAVIERPRRRGCRSSTSPPAPTGMLELVASSEPTSSGRLAHRSGGSVAACWDPAWPSRGTSTRWPCSATGRS